MKERRKVFPDVEWELVPGDRLEVLLGFVPLFLLLTSVSGSTVDVLIVERGVATSRMRNMGMFIDISERILLVIDKDSFNRFTEGRHEDFRMLPAANGRSRRRADTLMSAQPTMGISRPTNNCEPSPIVTAADQREGLILCRVGTLPGHNTATMA